MTSPEHPIERALADLRAAGVPRPFLQNSFVHEPGGVVKEWWEVCSLGWDNYNVVLLGEGPTITAAMRAWARSQTSVIATKKSNKSL